ncbi:MAG: hypothetical protein JNL90_14890 [Planctomycetes bacterium]|nr:hypothetical protein [Planctomycetota bacterium]
MQDALAPAAAPRAGLHDFIEQVRAELGHDLRTPLSTIVTCSALLEEDAALSTEVRRDLLARIRSQAMQTAEMLQMLLDATLVAATAPKVEAIVPAALLQTIVGEIEGEWVPQRNEPARAVGQPPEAPVRLDAAVVGFAWRAFLLVDKVLAARARSTAAVVVTRQAGGVRLDLGFAEPPETRAPALPLAALPASGARAVPRPHRLALRLAHALVRSHDGELALTGVLGDDARMSLDFGRRR